MQTPNSSLFAVFSALLAHGEISRGELSDITGFSRVTVGKSTDILERAGILKRVKMSSGNVGRKSDACILQKNRGMLLFDMSENPGRAEICDITLKSLCQKKSNNPEELISEVFGSIPIYDISEIIGIGCIAEMADFEKINESFLSVIGSAPTITLTPIQAHGVLNSHEFSGRFGIYARAFESCGDGVIVDERGLYLGAHGRAGISRGELTFEEFISKISSVAEAIDTDVLHISFGSAEELKLGEGAIKKIFGENKDGPKIILKMLEECDDILKGIGMMTLGKYLAGLLKNQ